MSPWELFFLTLLSQFLLLQKKVNFCWTVLWLIHISGTNKNICIMNWVICSLQRLWSTPAVSPLWCWVKPCPLSPRTWIPTPTACPLECVLASPPSTSLPWFLFGWSPWAWCVATHTCWSRQSGYQPVPCCWLRCCKMPALQMGRSTSSMGNMTVRVGLCNL